MCRLYRYDCDDGASAPYIDCAFALGDVAVVAVTLV